MMHRLMSCAAALVLLAVAAPAAAQTSIRDRDILSREHSGNLSSEERGQLDGIKASQAAQDAKHEADVTAARMRQGRALLNTPPLPAERNGLLGNWRLGDGQRPKAGAADVLLNRRAGLGETLEALSSLDKVTCAFDWGGGITFTSSTYSVNRGLAGVVEGAPIAYRSGRRGAKQVTFAITPYYHAMAFEIASPNSIVDDKGCVLTRVGAPAANAAANATAAPGNARPAAASPSALPGTGTAPQVAAVAPSPPPSTLSRPSPEVCRNTLIDKLGTVGSNQVRAMSDVRFKEAAIEGKVPNTNNLRIDLRGSACDDPRIKATLYDFDASEMLQSITYVWERPPGPAPTPIFNERTRLLVNWYAPGSTQSPSHWQGASTTARVTLQDLPERALLLEAYSAPK